MEENLLDARRDEHSEEHRRPRDRPVSKVPAYAGGAPDDDEEKHAGDAQEQRCEVHVEPVWQSDII